MVDKIKRGTEGERAAAEFLISKGFEILQHNYRHKRSEIDLIVRKDNWLIFVEVKLRSSARFGHPEEFVDRKKEKKILEGAAQYLHESNWQGNVRYDIVAVSVTHSDAKILHIEDAFY
jgi:putative endonuclease